MKLLFISNIIGKKVGSFAMASINAATALDIDYHMAANFNNSSPEQMRNDEEQYGITLHHIDFERNPVHPKNIIAYFQLIKLIKSESFDAIHCNTPIGGLLGRLVGRQLGIRKVLYQAHGFHFYKGGPIVLNFVFKTIEKFLAHWTDAIITINQEDYEAAQSFHLRNGGKTYKVHGVGIDLADYSSLCIDRACKRSSLGLKHSDIVCISAGDLVPRKNYRVSIDAIAKANVSNLHYLICGEGPELEYLTSRARELGIERQVHFLGFRSDVKELMYCSDIFLFSTIQEGLPRSLMEAMAIGLPVIASQIRGNVDLLADGLGGYLCDPFNCDSFTTALNDLCEKKQLRISMGDYNRKMIKKYDFSTVCDEIKKVYENVL